MDDIVLTLKCHSPEMAQHILEAYAEAKGLNGGGKPYTKPETPASAPEANGEPDAAGAPPVTHDARGVPFNAAVHQPKLKDDGTWRAKRNHKELADAYDAQFLAGNAKPAAAGGQAAVTAQPASGGPSAGGAAAPAADAPTAGASTLPASAMPAAPAAATPMPEFAAPAVRYLPTIGEYRQKWTDLCRGSWVTAEHENFIRGKFGEHPCHPVVQDVEENRRQIWVLFESWEAGVKGF